jgi:hypothetical protein
MKQPRRGLNMVAAAHDQTLTQYVERACNGPSPRRSSRQTGRTCQRRPSTAIGIPTKTRSMTSYQGGDVVLAPMGFTNRANG